MRHSKPPPQPPGPAARAPGPIDLARVRTWPAEVRAAVRTLLLRDSDLTSPALHTAVREITDLIDEANREEGRG